MALTSPGVEVTVIDESQYIPAATNSVPYILIATATNKVSGAGVGVAAGTLAANANKIYLITSQRDLSATYGVPFFYKTTAGTPINGYELNEYGLLAAYSALGVTNRAYIQRVDIDLAELTATLVRPTGSPDNNIYWLDLASSIWGIFQWNQTTSAFTNQIPSFITDTAYLEPSTSTPLPSYGNIGDYAVTTTDLTLPLFFKRGGPTADQTSSSYLQSLYNTWVPVGSEEWKTSWPAVQGTLAPTSLTAGNIFTINGVPITVPNSPNNTVTGVADYINLTATVPGVYAANINGRLTIYCDAETVLVDSTNTGGAVEFENSSGTPLTSLGISVAPVIYHAPEFLATPSYQQPRWRSTDTIPEPTGSVWQKTNSVNLGTNLSVKKYNSTLGTFVQQACPVYTNSGQANYGLDPSGGGANIPAGTTFARLDPYNNSTASMEIQERYATGPTVITGNTESPGPFTPGDEFTIYFSLVGTTNSASGTAIIGGTGTVNDYLNAVSQAIGNSGYNYVTAAINSNGSIVYTHSKGGNIRLIDTVGTPTADAGIKPYVSPSNTGCRGVTTNYVGGIATGVLLSNWVTYPTFSYIASAVTPDQDPIDGRLWYYSATNQCDIMIQNNGVWCGYQTVTNDVRGDNLTLTNASGPMFSTTAPVTQNNESLSPLQYGDLWIDTSDLENYPAINRWSNVDGHDEWVLLSNADQTTENGVLFADARWAPNGITNPITDPIPSITSLLTSNYLDIDAPRPSLYPQGILLFNTRRSGFNVKSFQVNYFNGFNTAIPQWSATDSYVTGNQVLYNGTPYVCIASSTNNPPPDTAYWDLLETNCWVTASGNKNDGSPYMGRQAQRALIVAAFKSGIDSSIEAREEQRQYNLIGCPQYPELIPNMIELNNDRKDTAFVIGDTPLRLGPSGTDITYWVTNNGGAGTITNDGLGAADPYCGVFYPSCQTTDLSGTAVVQPPSHMMIRTIIRSDEVAYPWLAPAGTRRGVIDNAARIGYINGATGEFITLGVNQAQRDVLYENRINPITFIPGIGITNFGNKTTTAETTAMDRINVARLVAFIRGRLQEIGNNFLFEPNDQITRNEIRNTINSLMIDLVNKRGIYDYLVICDLTNNTPARIDRNELYVDIAIEPVKAVEFIYIPLRLKNTGEIAANLSTTAVSG